MLSNVFAVSFSGVASAVAMDLFAHQVPTGKVLRLLCCRISQTSDAGDAEAEQLSFLIERVTGGTVGSGGSTFTPVPVDARQSDSTAQDDWRINDTTQNTGGTREVLDAFSANVEHGYIFKPDLNTTPTFLETQYVAISMEAPGDSLSMDGVCIFQVANSGTAAF